MSVVTSDGAQLLSVSNLRVAALTPGGSVPILRGVDLSLARGASLGIVGESGSGKSMTMLAALGLLPKGVTRQAGRVTFDGLPLSDYSERQMADVRGRRVGVVFQDPQASLNPVMTVGRQVAEPVMRHLGVSRRDALGRAAELLDEVGIPSARERLGSYPHEFSGGMRQRVMIAIALACDPDLLIADEATTALDVTVQAQVLKLLRRLKEERGLSLIFVSHDLGLVSGLVDHVAVMYAGQIVEYATASRLFSAPEHPYTEALLRATPSIDGDGNRSGRFPTIPGQPPRPGAAVPGCAFSERCPYASDVPPCASPETALREVTAGHWARTTHAASERRTATHGG